MIFPPASVHSSSALAGAGGKGAHLLALREAGFNVPPFGVLGATALDRLLDAANLRSAIDAALVGLTVDTAPAAADEIRRILNTATVDVDTQRAIAAAYDAAGGGHVAVRSSAIGEDGADHSFAGQGSSFLHVSGLEAVTHAVAECWASAWSGRALTYRLLQDLPIDGIRTAVVIQAMVESEVSGVLFTVNPTSGDVDELVLSAVYGLGEGLVSGQVDADTITLHRHDGTVISTQLGEKEARVERAADGTGITTVAESPERRAAPALTPSQIAELQRVGLAIEHHFGAPQDVEWGFAEDRLWILQSRPVTSVVAPRSSIAPAPGRHTRLWDNANIVENFGEITAPLTFSFASHIYGVVYLDYCRELGVPASQLRRMRPWTDHLLGQFDGRVYYNVLNWYMVLRLVPLPRIQQKVLAATAGIRETPDDIGEAQRPMRGLPRALERAVHLKTSVTFARRFFTAGRTTQDFLDKFNQAYADFEQLQLDDLPAHEAWAAYEDLEGWMAEHWGPTAVLDAVISLSLGVLYGLTQKWLPDAPEWFLWQAVKVDSDQVESALPPERLTAIAGRIKDDTALTQLVTSTDPGELRAALDASDLPGAAWLRTELDQYLVDFGDRAMNEMKLEEPDLREDPTQAWLMLVDAVKLPAAPSAGGKGTKQDRTADAWLSGRLSLLQRPLYGLVRRKVQASLMNRENVRFARSRVFAMVRRLMRTVGEGLARQGLIDAPRDVYYLRLDELRGIFHGTTDQGELRGLVALRRERETQQRAAGAPPARFYTQGLPQRGPYVEDVPIEDGPSGLIDGVLHGRPSCPGVVEAEARVVDAPRDVSGCVLVTYRTDPGWVGALSSASALLIERGSPLTHVAVVARELDIPTVVQIPGLTKAVTSGMRLRVDGGAGTAEILSTPDSTPDAPEATP